MDGREQEHQEQRDPSPPKNPPDEHRGQDSNVDDGDKNPMQEEQGKPSSSKKRTFDGSDGESSLGYVGTSNLAIGELGSGQEGHEGNAGKLSLDIFNGLDLFQVLGGQEGVTIGSTRPSIDVTGGYGSVDAGVRIGSAGNGKRIPGLAESKRSENSKVSVKEGGDGGVPVEAVKKYPCPYCDKSFNRSLGRSKPFEDL